MIKFLTLLAIFTLLIVIICQSEASTIEIPIYKEPANAGMFKKSLLCFFLLTNIESPNTNIKNFFKIWFDF